MTTGGVSDAMVWIVPTGAPRRDLPAKVGSWTSVFRRVRRRSASGLRDVMLQASAAGGRDADLLQRIGSTSISAHHCAASGRGEPQSPGSWPFAQWPCEHAPPPRPGARSAHRPAPEQRPKGRLPERRGTDGGARQRPRPHARRHALRQRSDQAAPARPPQCRGAPHHGQLRVQHSVSRALSRLRRGIACFITRLKDSRRVATRCDSTTNSVLALGTLASIRPWSRAGHAAYLRRLSVWIASDFDPPR